MEEFLPCNFIEIKLVHGCISSKFAALLQNTFSEEHLWRAASEHLLYNKKHIYIEHILLSNY